MLFRFSFKAKGFDGREFLAGIEFKKFMIPLIERFYDDKILDIFEYWKQVEVLHQAYNIDMLFWANPPHRYPAGITKEYFRVHKVPICGMQHGGFYGSSNLGRTIKIDFNNCDYYFSYGFSKEDLEDDTQFLGKTQIIPVGSTVIKECFDKLKISSKDKTKEKVDILFPVALANDHIFFESELTNPKLFHLQKEIVDILAVFNGKKIILKFPVGKYMLHPLRPFIEDKYPGRFIIIDNVSFTESLNRYNPLVVLLEESSTPLNEAVVSGANIIVYNSAQWHALTNSASGLLRRRAVICNDVGSVAENLNDYMSKRMPQQFTDISNKEFIEKYCIYHGEPQDNIRQEIKHLLSGVMKKNREY